jgi:hypothetical protein
MPMDALQALRQRQQDERDALERKRKSAVTARLAAEAQRRKNKPTPEQLARRVAAKAAAAERVAALHAVAAPDKLDAEFVAEVRGGHEDSVRAAAVVVVDVGNSGTSAPRDTDAAAAKTHYLVTGGRDCLAILWTKPALRRPGGAAAADIGAGPGGAAAAVAAAGDNSDAVVGGPLPPHTWLRRRHFNHGDWVDVVSLSSDVRCVLWSGARRAAWQSLERGEDESAESSSLSTCSECSSLWWWWSSSWSLLLRWLLSSASTVVACVCGTP